MIAADVDGDLRGHGRWTLTETAAGTHVRFDWNVSADRRLLRALSPLLRPALRWNHAWAIARAREGLEPFARSVAAVAGAERQLRLGRELSVPAGVQKRDNARRPGAAVGRVLHRGRPANGHARPIASLLSTFCTPRAPFDAPLTFPAAAAAR